MTSAYIYPFQTFPWGPDLHPPAASTTSPCGHRHAKARLDFRPEPALPQSPRSVTKSFLTGVQAPDWSSLLTSPLSPPHLLPISIGSIRSFRIWPWLASPYSTWSGLPSPLDRMAVAAANRPPPALTLQAVLHPAQEIQLGPSSAHSPHGFPLIRGQAKMHTSPTSPTGSDTWLPLHSRAKPHSAPASRGPCCSLSVTGCSCPRAWHELLSLPRILPPTLT